MSLRDQVKDALDDVAPPAPTLERRVTAFVFADKRDRRVLLNRGRRHLRTGPFRGMAALVAAALVLTLMVGVVIGGRLGRDLGNGESSQAYAINQSELHSLESRPFVLPVLQPGAVCPFSPELQENGQWVGGRGPVFAYNAWRVTRTNRVDWVAFALAYVAQRPGMVLIRARDLHTDQAFVFTQYTPASGVIAAGPVLGKDRVEGRNTQLHPESVIEDPWQQQPNQQLVVMFAVPLETLCWGFQFDGPGFSQTLVDGWDDLASKGL
jgi:hypothetical protein